MEFFMKIQIIISAAILLCSQAMAGIPGFVCRSECVGIDYNEEKIYQIGQIDNTDPDRDSAFQGLQSVCEYRLNVLGIVVPGSLVRKIDFSGSIQGYGYSRSTLTMMRYGFYLSSSASSEKWDQENHKMHVKVEYDTEVNSCHFDPNAGVPDYNGPLPAQG